MRSDRLLAIIMRLLESGQVTARDLARHFGTSERTIYRDIETLSLAGVPVAALPGPGGGYSMAEGYTMDRGFLGPDEILSLVSALSTIQEAAGDRRLGLALEKIKALGAASGGAAGSPAAGSRRLPSAPLPPSLVVSPHPWGMKSPGSELAETLRGAIEERRPVRFSYESGRGPTAGREVEPFTIALGGSTWYLHGWCRLRSSFRIFRLSRITGLEVLTGHYDPAAHGEVPPVWGTGWGSDEILKIKLRFSPALRLSVLDSFSHSEIEDLPDGGAEAAFSWPASDPPLRFILGFGPGVEVLEPEWLRSELARAAAAMAGDNGACHGGNQSP